MNLAKFGLILLGVAIWAAPIVAAFLFKEPQILWAWVFSFHLTGEIVDAVKRL